MLEGKSALVTGSTSGIGLAIAQSLARSGANVMLNGFGSKKDIEEIRERIAQETGRDVLYFDADMSKPKQIQKMVAQTIKVFGSVDILVNNVGIQHVSPIETFPEEKWDAIIGLNLSSAFHATKAVFEQMKKNKWGRIINTASAHALVASPHKAAYVAAKHGLLGLTKVVALEGAEHGVTCNAICPGYVWTPLVAGQIKDTAKARKISEKKVIHEVILAQHPTKEFVTMDQLCDLALFLCGDHARNITGTALPVDGGWTCQ